MDSGAFREVTYRLAYDGPVPRPVIGLCTAVEQARWNAWDLPAALIPLDYIRAVQAAGGLAVLLPPDPLQGPALDETLDLIDGLILAGGADVDPATYDAERHVSVVHSTPERDTYEVALARRALERDLPFLGICRGMQILNVALGGDLHQHLPDVVGHSGHLRNPGSFDGADHMVRLEPGSLAARVTGEETHRSLSHHHQAINRVGDGLTVTGWATDDDLPEVVEVQGARFALGVQWHPEADETSPLIAALVAEAAAARVP
jgi:putative glutamine amidotransferase